ncbi:MAG: EI24 domain-containing protein [Rhodocyclaceae bacterium]|nr:EI24 domain-containing protein [Rhodocyclaceae bacterium]
MHEVTLASLRAIREFSRGDILWQALWPPLVSLFGWVVIAWFAWMPTSAWLLAHLPAWSWLDWLGSYLVHVTLALVFAPLIYATTLLLVAAFALPRMMAIVAARDYPEVSRHGTPGAAFWGSIGNTLVAGLIFVAGWLLCLPLLLIPAGCWCCRCCGAPGSTSARSVSDVLAEHATPEERRTLVVRERSRFRAAGFVSALAAYVPFANVLAPAFAALLFTHLGLSALRRLRAREGVWVT